MKNKTLELFRNIGITVLFLSFATGLGGLFRFWNFPETNIVVLYIFSVLLIARFTNGYAYGVLASILSNALFNWFFTEPYYTLKVNDPTYIVTFVIMTITAIITSALTTKVKDSAIKAKAREEESYALYKMTSSFTTASDIRKIAEITIKTLSSVLPCTPSVICFDENGDPEETYLQQKGNKTLSRNLEDREIIKTKYKDNRGVFESDDEFFYYPIHGKEKIFALIRIPKESAELFSQTQTRILYSIVESASLAMERLYSLHEQAKSREEAVQEHYRGNLLRAISHDIRTPLAGIMGSGEMLMGMTDKEDPRYEIAEGIYKDADWLHALVENILNLTRIQDGRLTLDKSSEAVEEVISAAIMVMEKRAPERDIKVSVPDALIMVPMDVRLICQVLVNLLDNAVKHTPEDKEIGVSAELSEDEKYVVFTVFDRGSGLVEKDIKEIFQMFYTTRAKSADSQRGIGLGLSICQSIVEAHGGTIKAENRPDGGAQFIFTLPTGGTEK